MSSRWSHAFDVYETDVREVSNLLSELRIAASRLGYIAANSRFPPDLAGPLIELHDQAMHNLELAVKKHAEAAALIGKVRQQQEEADSSLAQHLGSALGLIATAIASGVVGNVAYDMLKSALKRRKAETPNTAEPSQAEERWLLAKLATQARCAELEYPVPRFEDFDDVDMRAGSDAWLMTIKSTSIRAAVEIPNGNLDGTRLKVTIFQVLE